MQLYISLHVMSHITLKCISNKCSFHTLQVIWPQSIIITGFLTFPLLEPTASMAFNTLYPSCTCPNTTCLLSNHGVATKHKKNCDPLVFGPEFAIDKMPGPTCFLIKFSSSNNWPKMDIPSLLSFSTLRSPPWHMNFGMIRWNFVFL